MTIDVFQAGLSGSRWSCIPQVRAVVRFCDVRLCPGVNVPTFSGGHELCSGWGSESISCVLESLLVIVMREPSGTVTDFGAMPADVMMSVAAMVPSLPVDGADGLSLPHDTAVMAMATMNRDARMEPIRRTSS